MEYLRLMNKLTKQTIARLNAAPVLIRTLNGCFNVATVIASANSSRYSGPRVELRVEVTHPFLQWQCGNNNEVKLICWKGGDGRVMEAPSELEPLVEKLRLAATMTDEEAQRIGKQNAIAAADSIREFGLF